MKVVDLAEAIAPGAKMVDIGIRPGEKLHEEMISMEDARRTIRQADRYIVEPTLALWGGFKEAVGDAVPEDFAYTSDINDLWLDVEQLRTMLDELGL
jgi:UDP-N-acetylglucosamine 4,6-dehydratase